MAKLLHKYTTLEKATQVSRRHVRDLPLPSLSKLENMYVSRSDNVPSLRHPFTRTTEIINSWQDQVQASTTLPEYINSISGVYGTDDLIYFTSYWPIAAQAGAQKTALNTGYADGVQISELLVTPISSGEDTATVEDKSKSVTVTTSSFDLQKTAYQGCFIVFDEDDDQYYWLVDRVIDTTTFVLDKAINTANFNSTTSAFTVYQATNVKNLGGYKYHIDQYGSETLYGVGTVEDDIGDENAVVGPWSSSSAFYTPKFNWNATLGEQIGVTDQPTYDPYWSSYQVSESLCVGENDAILSFPKANKFYWCDTLTASGFVESDNWTEDDTNTSSSMMAVTYNTTDNKFYTVYIDDQAPNYYWEIETYTDDGTMTLEQFQVGTDATTEAMFTSGYVTSICYVDTTDEVWFSVAEQVNSSQPQVTIKRWDCAGEAWLSDVNVGIGGAGSYFWIADMQKDPLSNSVFVTLGSSTYNFTTYYTHASVGTTTLTLTYYSRGEDDGAVYGLSFWSDGSSEQMIFSSGSITQVDGVTQDQILSPKISKLIVYDGNQGEENIISSPAGYNGSGAYRVYISDFDAAADPTTEKVVNKRVLVDLSESNYWDEAGSTTIRYPTTNVFPCRATDDYNNRLYFAVSTQYNTDELEWKFKPVVFQSSLATGETSAVAQRFTLLSDIYRSRAFAVTDGYTILFGTREYDETATTWTYNPRRVRWTSPGTVSDFTSAGAGFGDVKGNGQFLDARVVNGRVVLFESTSISALVPRGVVADPWDYEILHENIRILSNPVAVQDSAYFVSTDGLLYSTDGIIVQELKSSFDLSEYDDFDETKPVWCIYVPRYNSIAVFLAPTAADEDPHYCYLISLANGAVSQIKFYDIDNGSGDNVPPRSIVNVEFSSDQRFIFGFDYHEESDRLDTAYMDFGSEITGLDHFNPATSYDQYYYGLIESGFQFLAPEGQKASVKHLIFRTYTDTTGDDRPIIFVELQGIGDTDWRGVGDPYLQAAITIDGVACQLPDTTPVIGGFSNRLGLPGGNVTYNTPWPAKNCRVFQETGGTYTAMTETTNDPPTLDSKTYLIKNVYQIEVNESAGYIWVFNDGHEPAVKSTVGDIVYHDQSDEVSVIKTIDGLRTATLDHYLNSDYGSTTNNASHLFGYTMPSGEGEVKVGVNALCEGLRIRVGIVPITDGTGTASSTAKVTGVTIGYVPLGKKTLTASGA